MKLKLTIFIIIILLLTPAIVMFRTGFELRKQLREQQLESLKQYLENKAQSQLIHTDLINHISSNISGIICILSEKYGQENPSKLFGQIKNTLSTELAKYSLDFHYSIAFYEDSAKGALEFKNGQKIEPGRLASITYLISKNRKLYPTCDETNTNGQIETEIYRLLNKSGFYIDRFIMRKDGGSFADFFIMKGEHSSNNRAIIIFKSHHHNIFAVVKTTVPYNESHTILDYRVKNYGVEDFGIAFIDGDATIKSDYIKNNDQRTKIFDEFVNTMCETQKTQQLGNYLLTHTKGSPYSFYTVALMIPLPKQSFQVHVFMIAAIYSIFALYLSKKLLIIIKKKSFNLGAGRSIVISFCIAMTFPVVSSLYLLNNHIMTVYNQQINEASQNLSRRLQSVDDDTHENLRNSVLKAKSFNSIQAIADYVEKCDKQDIVTLAIELFNQLYSETMREKYDQAWIYKTVEDFYAIRFGDKEKKYEIVDLEDRQVGLDVFIASTIGIHFEESEDVITPGINPKTSLSDEVLGEMANEMFHDLFGHESYYNLQRDPGNYIELEFSHNKLSVLQVPIMEENRLKHIISWIMASFNLRAMVPQDRFHINDHSVTGALFSLPDQIRIRPAELREAVFEGYPELLNSAIESSNSGYRISRQIQHATSTTLIEALPSIHSDFVIFGQVETDNYLTIQNRILRTVSILICFLIIASLTMSMLVSSYFMIPIRELINATKEIIKGNYNLALNSEHPDDFKSIAETFNKMTQGLAEGKLLEKFVSKSTEKIALSDKDKVSKKAHKCNATIIFSCIHGFEDIIKNFDSDRTVKTIQSHFNSAVEATSEYGGEIDKIIEDKVMIVIEGEDPLKADLAALKLSLCLKQRFKNETNLDLAIGINSGEVISGIFGAESVRLSKTVTGDNVNLAARLSQVANNLETGGIVAGKNLVESNNIFEFKKLPVNKVKGKKKEIEVYKLCEPNIKQP